MSATPPTAGFYLICIAGPDRGKRAALGPTPVTVGRSAATNVLSDDPDVTDTFATLRFDGARLHVDGHATLLPFVDGHPAEHSVLGAGQQLRLGRSVWEVHGPDSAPSVFAFVNRIGDHLSNVAGIEKPGEWNPREMFADVGKKHTDEEIENYFTVGTATTTPSLMSVDASRWPKPWVFGRVFLGSVVLYLGFRWAWLEFLNPNLLPGLMVIGSVAIPFSLLIFFFEVNVPRNISLYQIIKLVLTGGLVSIFVSLIFFRWTNLDNVLGAASAGIIEETGKALTLLLVVNKTRFRWTLNGLLLGAAVGTGFAVFESAGYALNALDDGAGAMRDVIMQRGFLSILGGHVLWTGLVGAALWRVRGNRPFTTEMLTDPRFLRVLGVCMAMHMVWNSPWNPAMYLKYLLLGAAAWLLVLGMIQSGLKEVREAQAALSTAERNASTS